MRNWLRVCLPSILPRLVRQAQSPLSMLCNGVITNRKINTRVWLVPLTKAKRLFFFLPMAILLKRMKIFCQPWATQKAKLKANITACLLLENTPVAKNTKTFGRYYEAVKLTAENFAA